VPQQLSLNEKRDLFVVKTTFEPFKQGTYYIIIINEEQVRRYNKRATTGAVKQLGRHFG
jgi:hypothetical protein